MKENKLIKYDGKQLEKIKNIIAITEKLLEPVRKEEQDLILQKQEKDNQMQLGGLIIKKQTMKEWKRKIIEDYFDMEEQLKEEEEQWRKQEEQRRKEEI